MKWYWIRHAHDAFIPHLCPKPLLRVMEEHFRERWETSVIVEETEGPVSFDLDRPFAQGRTWQDMKIGNLELRVPAVDFEPIIDALGGAKYEVHEDKRYYHIIGRGKVIFFSPGTRRAFLHQLNKGWQLASCIASVENDEFNKAIQHNPNFKGKFRPVRHRRYQA